VNTKIFDKKVSLSPWQLKHLLADRLLTDSLLRNSVYIMSSTVATAAIGYLYWIVVAHIYPEQDVGLASAFIAAMTITSTVASLGIGPTLVQILPHRETGYAWSLTLNAGMIVSTLASLLAGVIVAIALPLFSHQFAILGHHLVYALVFIVSVPLFTVATLIDQVFVAERVTSKLLVRNTVFAVLKLPLALLLVQVGALGIFSSWILALAATLILARLVLVPGLKRVYCLALRGLMEQVRSIFSCLAWHHFITLGGLIPMYILPVFVIMRLSAVANAYFYTTWMIGSIFFMVSSAVAMSLFAEGSHSADDVLRKARSSAVISGALLCPSMLAAFLAGHYILLLFGPNYAEYGLPLLIILTFSAVPDAITNIYVSVLRVQRRLRHAALLSLGMALLNLALAWILLPMLGIVGAGWSFLIAQVAGSLVAGADIIFIRGHRNPLNFGPQEVPVETAEAGFLQLRLNLDQSLPATPHPDMALLPEDMVAFFSRKEEREPIK
jgi:O-antigen/teichoic acid export membrane protein